MSAQTDAQSIATALFELEAALNAQPFVMLNAQRKCAALHALLARNLEVYAASLGIVPSEIQGGGTNKSDEED